jgi:hypothetical protein
MMFDRDAVQAAAEKHGPNSFPTWGQLLELVETILAMRHQERQAALAAAAANAAVSGAQLSKDAAPAGQGTPSGEPQRGL